jgi:hypothetical protein
MVVYLCILFCVSKTIHRVIVLTMSLIELVNAHHIQDLTLASKVVNFMCQLRDPLVWSDARLDIALKVFCR